MTDGNIAEHEDDVFTTTDKTVAFTVTNVVDNTEFTTTDKTVKFTTTKVD